MDKLGAIRLLFHWTLPQGRFFDSCLWKQIFITFKHLSRLTLFLALTAFIAVEASTQLPYLENNTLYILGTDGPDSIQVSDDGNLWKVQVSYNDGESDDERWFDQSLVNMVVVKACSGDDQVQMNGGGEVEIPFYMYGDGGNDQLQGGDFADTIFGGEGNDQIQGNDGNDTLIGGDGVDSIQGGNGTNSVQQGGSNGTGSAICAFNRAPEAFEAIFSVNENSPLSIELEASDPDSDPLTFEIQTPPQYGVLTGNGEQRVYLANPGFIGVDSFTFTANDGSHDSNVATVTINVRDITAPNITAIQTPAPNQAGWNNTNVMVTFDCTDGWSGIQSCTAPINVITEGANQIVVGEAVDLAGSTSTESVTINLDKSLPSLTVTSPADGSTLTSKTVQIIGQATDALSPVQVFINGTPVVLNAGQFSHTLTLTEGANTVEILAEDAAGNTSSETINLSVILNQPPVANDQILQVDEDKGLSIILTASDIDGDALSYQLVSQPINGTLSGIAPNLTYQPTSDYSGVDSFTFKANDGTNDSNVATVTITINNVNDVPVGSSQAVSTNEDNALTITLNGSDVENDPLSYQIGTQPLNGVLSGSAPELTYTPDSNFAGSDSFSFTVSDGVNTSVEAFISITVLAQNDAPIAQNQTISMAEDSSVDITLTASDIESDSLTYYFINGPVNGELNGVAPNLTYTPNTDFNGPDAFTYLVNDGTVDSLAATVSVTVAAVNDIPVANSQTVTSNEDVAVSITLTGSDPDGDVLTYQIMTQPALGLLSGIAPNLIYTPNANINGNDSFTFIVNDGLSSSSAVAVSLTVVSVNDQPLITSQPVIDGAEGSLYQYQVNASDPDDTFLSYTLTTAPTGMSIDGNGLINWIPGYEEEGIYPVEIQVQDGQATSTVQSYNLTITNTNRAPEIVSEPIAFVVEGDNWTYTLQAVDADGDNLTITMGQSPGGAVFNAQTGEITWATSGLATGNYDFSFAVQDSAGLTAEQSVTVEILSLERTVTHEGTEFRIPFSINFEVTGNVYHIFLVSNQQNANVTINIPSLGINQQLVLQEGIISDYSIAAEDVEAIGGFDRNRILSNHAIHITASKNISVYVLNQEYASTDGFLALPVAALGKQYIVGHYTTMQRDLVGRDPVAGIVATQDNTLITIKGTMDLFFGENSTQHEHDQVNTGNNYTLTLNAGDVYNLQGRGSEQADLTGTLISADKPIAVLGESPCALVPKGYMACDQLVEQLPPVESLGVNYITAPLYGRARDIYRIVAPFDSTAVYINGVLRTRLNSQQYFEFFSAETQNIQATQPVLLLQYSGSDGFDHIDSNRLLEPNHADPFMIVVPPVEQYLKKYTVNTPIVNIARNFINVIMPTSAIATATFDGTAMNAVDFTEIQGGLYSFAQFEVVEGSHQLEASEPFGVYVYGNDYYESYGYLGGMAFSLPDAVQSLTLNAEPAATELPVGEELCLLATVKDSDAKPLNGVRVEFEIQGTQSTTGYALSNYYGEAQYCYSAYQQGIDNITAQVGSHSVVSTFSWLTAIANQPPVISSLPVLSSVLGENYSYQIVAIDPNGDELTYSLVRSPSGMSIDANGLLQWSNIDWSRIYDQFVTIAVQDSNGTATQQSFMLSEYKVFNTPPEFTPKQHSSTGTVGVPYVYDQEVLEHSLEYLKHQIFTSDIDNDGPDISLVNAPEGAYIELLDSVNFGPSCVGCSRFLRWEPTAAGTYQFELHLRDARGATAAAPEIFNVNVAANLPPEIVSINPPNRAVAGQEYTYLIEISNDVALGSNSNLDNLQVVIEQGPYNMRANLIQTYSTQNSQYYISWTPYANQVGLHTIRLRVDDRLNSSAVQEFTIEVVNDNQAPVITSTVDLYAEVSIPYETQIVATDPENDSLAYELLFAPDGMQISQSGLITWLPTASDFLNIGSSYTYYKIWVLVDDGRGGRTIQESYIYLKEFVNQSPTFLPAYRPVTAKVGVEYVHQLTAVDRENDIPITYGLSSSASGATIDAQTGTISWTPTSEGSFWFSVSATDSQGNYTSSNREFWYVQVLPDTAILDAQLQLLPANIIDLGETATLSIVTINEASTPQVTLTVDSLPATVDSLLQTQITPTHVGKIPVTATITDGSQTITRTSTLFVRDPADITPPIVQINSPTNLADITAPTEIFGTVQDDNLVETILLYKPADEPLSANLLLEDFTELYRSPGEFVNQAIASLDTTMLLNGTYHILLQATDSNNNTNGSLISVNVTGDLKVGNFSITLQDLNIPLAGIPITVSRTYDSRRRTENLDFGYGWSIDYQNVRLQESDEPTQGWTQTLSQGETFISGSDTWNSNAVCINPSYEKSVTITLPDGDTEKFIVVAKPTSGSLASATDPNCYLVSDRHYNLYFVAAAGTHSTLVADDTDSLFLLELENGYLAPIGEAAAWPITNYTLTTREAFVYHLDQDFGVTKIVDPNGHSVTYSDTGIVHSSGKTISFSRDINGRIEAITDPAGNQIGYGYNAQGDLTTVTDRMLAQSTFTYNNSHGLIDMFDPLDRHLMKNIYDADGRLVAQEDGDGIRTDFNHDITGRLSIVTNRRGYATQYGYDDHGNVLTEIDALSNITIYTYDDDDNQLSKTDARNHTSTATYNAEGDQLTQVDALLNPVTFTYNDYGQELTVTDAKDNVYTNVYNSYGNLLSITDPLDNAASTIYIGTTGLPYNVTNMLGHTTTYSYTIDWNKETETDPLDNVTSFTYDDNNNVLSESRTRTVDGVSVVETTYYTYDAQDRLRTTTNPLGQVTEQVYNLAGHKVQDIDELGRITEYTYDAYNRLTQTTYPDTTFASKTYDAEGNLDSETDRNGNTTIYVYDELNRLTRTTYDDGSYTQIEYDAVGNVTVEIDERGNRTEHEYDEVNRRVLTRGADLLETTFIYDENGNLTSQTDANNNTIQHVYNELDNRVTTIYPDLTESTTSYDAMGQATSRTDQNLKTMQYAYDKLGRLSTVTDALLNDTVYSYDEVGNKLTQTDAETRTTRWTYDALGRETSRILPLGQTESRTYDLPGNLDTHTDFNGQLTQYDYDSNNRATSVTYNDLTTESFGYDAEGNRTSATNRQNQNRSWSYDVRNRLTSDTKANGDLIEYGYDDASNRTNLTLTANGGTGQTTTYSFDVLNHLQSVTDENAQTTTYSYDNVGNRESVSYPNGNTTDYIYDALNRLTRQTSTDELNNILTDYQYILDASGHRTQITEASGRVTDYIYDDLYRLTDEIITDAINGNYNANYVYDKVGNRTYSTINGVQTAYTYDANDRLTQQGSETYGYDDNGNTINKTIDLETSIYSYDAKNHLESASLVDSGNITSASYNYDIDGIRQQKTENGIQVDYLIDQNRDYAQVLKETDQGTLVSLDYLYGDDLIRQSQDSANEKYYLYDGLGSTRALTDLTGAITDTYNYEAFGSTLNQTGTTPNNYLFTGEQYDQTLNQQYLRARYYDPHTARFTQQDTWMGRNKDPITLNKYIYADSNPVNGIDPSGKFTLTQFAVGSTILGALTTIANPSFQFGSYDSSKNFYAQDYKVQGMLLVGSSSKWGTLMSLEDDGGAAHPEEDDAIKTSEDGGTCEEIKYAITILVQSITHRLKWKNRDSGHEERIRILRDALKKLKGMYGFTCGFIEGETESVDDFIDRIPPG